MALRDLLGQVNPYVNIFVQVAKRIVANPEEEVRVVIIPGRNHGEEVDPRRYNAPLADEVTMILPGEPGEVGNRDVIVQRQYGGGLLRMSELAPSYDLCNTLYYFWQGKMVGLMDYHCRTMKRG
jgi:hypothetical protein